MPAGMTAGTVAPARNRRVVVARGGILANCRTMRDTCRIPGNISAVRLLGMNLGQLRARTRPFGVLAGSAPLPGGSRRLCVPWLGRCLFGSLCGLMFAPMFAELTGCGVLVGDGVGA